MAAAGDVWLTIAGRAAVDGCGALDAATACVRVCQPAITSRPTVTYPARSRTEDGDRFTIICDFSLQVGRSPNIARRFFGNQPARSSCAPSLQELEL